MDTQGPPRPDQHTTNMGLEHLTRVPNRVLSTAANCQLDRRRQYGCCELGLTLEGPTKLANFNHGTPGLTLLSVASYRLPAEYPTASIHSLSQTFFRQAQNNSRTLHWSEYSLWSLLIESSASSTPKDLATAVIGRWSLTKHDKRCHKWANASSGSPKHKNCAIGSLGGFLAPHRPSHGQRGIQRRPPLSCPSQRLNFTLKFLK
jgi:hypothetical protein